jgi:uncharacterized metal-binding protein YceD (DUF177 family)
VTVPPEFSRLLPVERIGAAGFEQDVAATPDECAALAIRLGIPAVLSLSCRFHLKRAPEARFPAEANLRATLVRECVVTLEPFETEVADAFQVVFVPAGTEDDDVDPESADEIPYPGGAIDLGEAAAEQLALTLDPYPHRPGATLPNTGAEPPESPFSVLARRTHDA